MAAVMGSEGFHQHKQRTAKSQPRKGGNEPRATRSSASSISDELEVAESTYKNAAFEGSSVAMMTIDRDFVVTYIASSGRISTRTASWAPVSTHFIRIRRISARCWQTRLICHIALISLSVR